MTDKEKILNEIKKRIQDNTLSYQKDRRPQFGKLGRIMEDEEILSFINSMQEEPADKDFEAALAEEWKGYNERGAAKVDALEDNTPELAFAKGFYRGWHYPKVSVWNDASEEPLPNKELFCIGEFNNPLVLSSNSESFKNRKIIKWAYFDSLWKL